MCPSNTGKQACLEVHYINNTYTHKIVSTIGGAHLNYRISTKQVNIKGPHYNPFEQNNLIMTIKP